jgi:hypothetical protein
MSRIKVLLRHKGTHLYHSGWGNWSALIDSGTDFESVERAIQRAKAEALDNVEIVVMRDGVGAGEVIQIRKSAPS